MANTIKFAFPSKTDKYPEFPGYRRLERSETLEEGDVAVADGPNTVHYSSWPNIKQSLSLNKYAGARVNDVLGTNQLGVYRQTGIHKTNKVLRLLGPNENFLEPLPLP